MSLYLITLPFTSIFSLVLAIFVLSKNPKNPVNITWCLTCLGVAAWCVFFILGVTSTDFKRALFLGKATNVAAGFIPTFLTHFCIKLTQRDSKKSRVALNIAYINSCIILLLSFTDNFLTVRPFLFFSYYSLAKPFFLYYVIHFFGFFIYHNIILLQAMRSNEGTEKEKLKIVFFGTTLGYLGGMLAFLGVYNVPVEPISVHFVWLYAAIITYGIAKHGVMDIQVVIKKTFVFFVLTLMISAVYLAGIFVIQNVISKHIQGNNSAFVGLFLTLLIALLLKPMEWYATRFTEKTFFKGSISEISEQKEKLVTELERSERLKSVGVLAAGMAHEIKNPLTSLKTFAQYLPTKYDDPEFRDRFSRIVSDEVDRVNSIVKQLLEFSKPEAPHLQSIDANKLIEDTLDLLSSNLLANKIQVKKQLSANSLINADKNQLKQVLLNIFLNAIQAMPNGGTLTASTSVNGSFILISIKDSGVGIPKEKLDKIFDPFFTTKTDGTGLGLSIVHGIIQNHGGRIDVVSDAGTEFRVLLPRVV